MSNNVTSKRNKQKETFLNTISKHFNVRNFNKALGLNNTNKLMKEYRELTTKMRNVKVDKTNFNKLTTKQKIKRYDAATKKINDLDKKRKNVLKILA